MEQNNKAALQAASPYNAAITREQFLERAWAWTKEYGGTIQKQQRKLASR